MPAVFQPANIDELRVHLEEARASARQIGSPDLRRMNRIIAHAAEDMTVSVEAGIALAELQLKLREKSQWLPVDPPNANTSIKEILDHNLSGPRRFGYGTIREHLIGITVLLANGKLIHSGGQVVKNVAGYDLQKLFVGAGGSLGVITECIFKLRPLPEMEIFVQKELPSLSGLEKCLVAILQSDLEPVVLDVVRLDDGPGARVVTGFAGTDADVGFQIDVAKHLGLTDEATLQYDRDFRESNGPVQKFSVLPSRLQESLMKLNSQPFVARAGNGIIYCRDRREADVRNQYDFLGDRIRETFDPDGLFSACLKTQNRREKENG